MSNNQCKCFFCRHWFAVHRCPKIRVDPTEGPSEYTVGRVCPYCVEAGRPGSTDTAHRLGNAVAHPSAGGVS